MNHARDTSDDIQARMDAAYRRMSDEEKFRRTMGLSATLRALMLDHLRELYPGETDRQLKIRILLRTTPTQIVEQAFGWLPPELASAGG